METSREPAADGAAQTAKRNRRGPGRPTLSNEELLDTALDLFLENGFERTSIEAICSAAGMAKRTVYARYGDKTSLFQAAINRAIDDHTGKSRRDRGDGRTTRRVKRMNRGIGIPNRHAFRGEHLRGGRFAHPDGTGKAKKERAAHAFRTASRRSCVTSGRRPNQRSNPGTA